MDEFLYRFRKEPKPELKRRLYQRINQPMKEKTFTQRASAAWKPALAGVAVILAATLAISPSARAMAQDFLNLFRVKRFAAVTVDPARVQQLTQSKVDLKALIGSETEVLKEPGKPTTVQTPQEAGQLAGITVKSPTALPAGFSLQLIQVQGAGSVRIKADTAKLQTLVQDLGVTDVQIPPQLDGKTVTVDTPHVVMMVYADAKDNHINIVQAHNPQVTLPDGVNLAQLGEIALRVTGMSADEAHRFAQSIDWSSTLLVPVPANASSFRQVDVRGNSGLLITTDPQALANLKSGGDARKLQPNSILVWTEGDMVYAISGSGNVVLGDLANSLQ